MTCISVLYMQIEQILFRPKRLFYFAQKIVFDISCRLSRDNWHQKSKPILGENNKNLINLSCDDLAGLGGSVGCAVRLETRRLRVQPPPRSATFFRRV